MHVLLQDKMEIKEGDESYSCELKYWRGGSDFLYGVKDLLRYPIRRKLTTPEEVQSFWKEAKECE